MEKRRVLLIGSMHFFVDLYSGFFAVYMVIAGLEPIKAALISSVASLLGDGLQPFLGFLSDRIRGKMPIFFGVVVGAVCMSAIGLTQDYALLFLLVLSGRIGISLFHPGGANIASAAGAEQKERSFSLFLFIGTLGLSFSQPYFSFFTSLWGNGASPLLALPALVLAFFYLLYSRMGIAGGEEETSLSLVVHTFKKRLGAVLLLFFIMVFRHGFVMTLAFYTAKIFHDWGFSRLVYSLAPTLFNLVGALAVLVSGYIARRNRAKTQLLFSLTAFIPFFALLVLAGGARILWLALACLGITGFILQLSLVPNVVLGHRLFPEMTSTISGILMGFAWAFGNLCQPLVAACAGLFPWAPGLLSGLVLLTVLPLAACLLVAFLPEPSGVREKG